MFRVWVWVGELRTICLAAQKERQVTMTSPVFVCVCVCVCMFARLAWVQGVSKGPRWQWGPEAGARRGEDKVWAALAPKVFVLAAAARGYNSTCDPGARQHDTRDRPIRPSCWCWVSRPARKTSWSLSSTVRPPRPSWRISQNFKFWFKIFIFDSTFIKQLWHFENHNESVIVFSALTKKKLAFSSPPQSTGFSTVDTNTWNHAQHCINYTHFSITYLLRCTETDFLCYCGFHLCYTLSIPVPFSHSDARYLHLTMTM